jgi:nitrate reductase gamma subunit
MYEIVTGPLLWLSFSIFFIGCLYRVIWYFRGLAWNLDRVAYKAHMGAGIKGALRSIFFWLFPFGTHSWRQKPGMTILFFSFHIGLIVTPIFLLAHNMILKERWGISLWTLPEGVADGLTITVMVACVLLILRRIALPEVRILTTVYDYLVLIISVAPFVTGYLASHQFAGYQFWLIMHILCGEIFLVSIPFTKLSHVVLFFCSRAQLGMDFGIKRGGMKGKGFAW